MKKKPEPQSQEHLRNPLPPMECAIPKDCKIKIRPDMPRITAEQCAMAVNCLVRDDAPRKLEVLHTTGMIGERGDEWVEASSAWAGGVYRFCFFVRGGVITNCFFMSTPKNSEYFINLDGGNPFDDVTIEDRMKLTALLVNSKEKKSGVEVVPCWIVTINGARPYSAHLHYSLEEAETARDEQEEHFKKYNKLSGELKDAQLTEQQIAKDRATVAVKAKSKGITKTKKAK